jgi:hypothetical protein
MANFPASCDECGFLFDTTTDHDQAFIDEHVAEHKAAHGLAEKLASEEVARLAAFDAAEAARITAAEATATPSSGTLVDAPSTPVEETL